MTEPSGSWSQTRTGRPSSKPSFVSTSIWRGEKSVDFVGLKRKKRGPGTLACIRSVVIIGKTGN